MKMRALSFAVGAALALGATQAQADQILFPMFESGNGTVTFITLRGDNEGDPVSTGRLLHYVWGYKTDPSDSMASCRHINREGSWTDHDLIQQTVAHPSESGINLPGSFLDQSTARYLNVGPTTGYLIVTDESPAFALGGQAIIVNGAAGLVSAYRAVNDPISNPTDTPNDGDFSFITNSYPSHDLTWYPVDAVATNWYALATGVGMTDPATGVVGVDGWAGGAILSLGFSGSFDRDENYTSGGTDHEFFCYDIIDLGDILTGDLHPAPTGDVEDVAGGGWTWVVNTPTTHPDVGPIGDGGTGNQLGTGVIMYKIETTTALGFPMTWISEENPFPNLP